MYKSRIGAAVIAGVVAGVVFGAMMQMMSAPTPDGGEITEERCADNANGRRGHASYAASIPHEGLDIHAHLECIERDLVAEALRRTAGNRTRAAELLKMEVHQFRYLLTKHDL